MNRMLTSVIAVGVGMAAYNFARKNNMLSRNQMRRMQKRITKAIF